MDEIRCEIELPRRRGPLEPGRLYGVLMAYGTEARLPIGLSFSSPVAFHWGR